MQAVPAAVPPIGSVPNWLILQPHNTKGTEWLYNLWQNFGRIFPEMAEKGPNIKTVLFPVFFPYKTLKNLEFLKILEKVRFQKCSNILMKLNQRCYFY